MRLHPQAIGELHSLHYIEFPRPEHFTADYHPDGPHHPIQQKQPRALTIPAATGSRQATSSSRATTSPPPPARGDTRFVIVTLGRHRRGQPSWRARPSAPTTASPSSTGPSPPSSRMRPELGPLPSPRAWYGSSSRARRSLPPPPSRSPCPAPSPPPSRPGSTLPRSLDAPLAKGDRVGEVVYSAKGQVLRRVDLVSASALPRGNVFILVKDFFARFFTRLFGG